MSPRPTSFTLVAEAPQPDLAERRQQTRFPIHLEVSYQLQAKYKKSGDVGIGRTKNISSRGACFSTERTLPVHSIIELRLEWPVRLDRLRLKLVVQGRIVRSDESGTGVRFISHEFRIGPIADQKNVTRGMPQQTTASCPEAL